MIMVRGGDEEIFEIAYFVVRPDKELQHEPRGGEDMVSEAIRIVDSFSTKTIRKKRSVLPEVVRFLAGMICGGGIVGLLFIALVGM